jgi:solute carrier family 15 oligopeptide transporter 1
MKTILSMYFTKRLRFSEDTATVAYHSFNLGCYFTPLFGALMADMWLGKFKTIFLISLIYVMGQILNTVTAIPTLGIPPVEFTFLGLFLIALGTGGIKPCVSAFGGDQFKLPEQTLQLETFFTIFYFSINCGSLLSTIITPILRGEKCFGDDSCFSLAFGVPALLMATSTLVIVAGRPLYTSKPPQGNVLPQVCGTIWYASCQSVRKKKEVVGHWLDRAKAKYDSVLVEDIKRLLEVLVLYLPLPVFWALYDQTGSRWTFQASRLNMEVIPGVINVLPEQMQVVNPALILIFLPLFNRVIYPLFTKCGILKRPLERMVVGGLLTASAFFISGFLELNMMKTYPNIPEDGVSHLNVLNSLNCSLTLKMENESAPYLIAPSSNLVVTTLKPQLYMLELAVPPSCLAGQSAKVNVAAVSKSVKSLYVSSAGGGKNLSAVLLSPADDPEKDPNNMAKVRILQDMGTVENGTRVEAHGPGCTTVALVAGPGLQETNYYSLPHGLWQLSVNGKSFGAVYVEQGGVYTLLLHQDPATGLATNQLFTLSVPNSISILWLLPQYVAISVGEVMFSVTGLEFSYSQAPASLKSVVQAAWLLTTALGNAIIIPIAEFRFFPTQMEEFFFFGAFMVADMLLFIFLSWRYMKKNPEADEKDAAA